MESVGGVGWIDGQEDILRRCLIYRLAFVPVTFMQSNI